MTGDGVGGAIYGLLLLVLVGSALAARRLPIGRAARMAAAWLLIFAVGFVAFNLRDEFATIGRRLFASPERGERQGRMLRIPMAADGHFWVRATVNGVAVRFLVDSGATEISLSDATARAAGLDPDADPYGVPIETANGTVLGRSIEIGRLDVGGIRRERIAANSLPAGGADVLGMNFLSSLSGWKVEGNSLLLTD